MQHSNNKRGLAEKRQAWMGVIEEKPNLRQTLICFSARGLATQDQVEKLTGFTTKQVRSALEDLLTGFYGNVPLLRSDSVHLEGRRGRPLTVYLLTRDGAAVLSQLLPEEGCSSSEIEDQVELAHALMEMEVYVLTQPVKMNCSLEYVIPFNERLSIRADVFIQNPDKENVILEMEQAARPGDIARILNKLKQYLQFFNSQGSKEVSNDVRILFNLDPADKMTIKRWGLILGDLQNQEGKLPFRLYWQPVLDFLQSPEWNGLATFSEIEPIMDQKPSIQLSRDQATRSALTTGVENRVIGDSLLPPLMREYQPVDLSNIKLILHVLANQNTTENQNMVQPFSGRGDFFEMMRTIYQVSHYKDGPVRKQAALPVLSLIMLYRYLNMHQNQKLLQGILHSRENIRKSLNHGVNLFRDAFSQMCWNFMRYHGYGRGGPLDISVRVPSLSGDESEIYVDVKISDMDLVFGEDGLYVPGDVELTEKALAWVLGAIWLYGDELGLSPVKTNKRKDTNIGYV
jgi:hypothetical protein